MKLRHIILVAILGLLLAGGVASAQTPPNSQTVPGATSGGTLTGGRYVLTTQQAAPARSTGYRLLDIGVLADPAPGCCCRTYLSCVFKQN
jgi:hypothetical protein